MTEVDQTPAKTDALQPVQQAAIAAGHRRPHHDLDGDGLVQDEHDQDVDQATEDREDLVHIEVGEDQGVQVDRGPDQIDIVEDTAPVKAIDADIDTIFEASVMNTLLS